MLITLLRARLFVVIIVNIHSEAKIEVFKHQNKREFIAARKHLSDCFDVIKLEKTVT